MENSLISRYPSVKCILDADHPLPLQSPYDRIKPYLGWKLVEVDPRSGCILLCQPQETAKGDSTMAAEKVILSGAAALEWLHHHARNRSRTNTV